MKTSRSFGLFRLLAIAVLAGCLAAQTAPATQGSSAATAASGSELDACVRDFRFGELEERIAGLPPSPERDYFGGVLANRQGQVRDSVTLLQRALPEVKAASPQRAAVALHALADDYVKLYRYADAIRAYEDLLHNYAKQLDKAERQSTTDDYQGVLLLKQLPPQTIAFSGPVDLPITRNPVLDTLDTELTVGGVRGRWLLDTGANFSAVSESYARRLGLKLLPGKAQTQGITGAENKLRAAVLPELKLGGAVLHNVVLQVLEDRSLNVPSGEHSRYQINAIIGYPVLQAFQRVTFTSGGHLLAGPDSPAVTGGARLFMSQLTPLLECKVEDRTVLFSFDTGANHSFYTDRYRREFPSEFSGLQKRAYVMGGAGGLRKTDAYYLPHPELGIGTTTVILSHVPVVPPLGTDQDKVFGNLGRDVTDLYRSFTIDFANMRLELGERLAGSPTPSH